ncbi:rCG60664 [Rattus norvegicus]|uniref:RCG60664 n=1 Tax=Rattus norvegicus TaxID=10116 RepID=A6JJX5_RAT|nr:rCG60664 [Rattus norvegicus]
MRLSFMYVYASSNTLSYRLKKAVASCWGGEDPICPVVGGCVQPAEHLRRGNRLWVHSHLSVGPPALR